MASKGQVPGILHRIGNDSFKVPIYTKIPYPIYTKIMYPTKITCMDTTCPHQYNPYSPNHGAHPANPISTRDSSSGFSYPLPSLPCTRANVAEMVQTSPSMSDSTKGRAVTYTGRSHDDGIYNDNQSAPTLCEIGDQGVVAGQWLQGMT